jgi:hypothetical protein
LSLFKILEKYSSHLFSAYRKFVLSPVLHSLNNRSIKTVLQHTKEEGEKTRQKRKRKNSQ